MAKIDDITRGEFQDILRRIRQLEYATPLNGSSVGSGGMRFYGSGTLTVENEGLYVIGVANISGTLTGNGALNWSGTTTLSGATTLAGPTGVTGTFTVQGVTKLNGATTVGGDFEIVSGGLFRAGATEIRPDGSAKFGTLNIESDGTLTSGEFELNPDGSAKFGLFEVAANGDLVSKGTLDIEGVTTLKNDLNVTTGGTISVGAMTLNPSAGGGRIEFDNGSVLSGGTGMTLADGGASASLTLANIAVLTGQGSAVTASLSGIQLTGPLTTVSGRLLVQTMNAAPGGSVANLFWDNSDKLLKYIP